MFFAFDVGKAEKNELNIVFVDQFCHVCNSVCVGHGEFLYQS